MFRRALEINEKSFGKDHPSVAKCLNGLAGLFYATNRINEAEQLMSRMVVILFKFTLDTGYQHSDLKLFIENYSYLLMEMGLSEEQAADRIKDLGKKYGLELSFDV
jgi:hypothetical protein